MRPRVQVPLSPPFYNFYQEIFYIRGQCCTDDSTPSQIQAFTALRGLECLPAWFSIKYTEIRAIRLASLCKSTWPINSPKNAPVGTKYVLTRHWPQ